MCGHLQRIKTIEKFKSPASKVVAVAHKKWSQNKKLGIFEKWSVMRGGRLQEVFAHEGSAVLSLVLADNTCVNFDYFKFLFVSGLFTTGSKC